MKVAAAQMKCVTYDKKANFEIARNLIEKAVKKNVKLIVLPELFNTGYCCTKRDWELAEEQEGETETFLRELSDRYSCAIIGGFVERSNVKGLVYNSLMYVALGQVVQTYRKMYLWGAEKNRFIAGDSLTDWDMNGISIAPQICYESGFSENAKIAALNGAELLIYSSAFGSARYYAWDINSKARAVETGCYVIASNHAGTEGDIEFCAGSRIIDPSGNIIAQAEGENDLAIADIDPDIVYAQRDALPYLRDIRTKWIADHYAVIEK